MNPGLAASCCVDPFWVFICPVLLSNNNKKNKNNNDDDDDDDDDDDNSRPYIVVLEKEGRVCFIVDVACLFDTRVAKKETETIDHFKDLKVEVQIKIWNCRRVSVIPVVMCGSRKYPDPHQCKWGWQVYTTPQRVFKIAFL